VKEFKIKKTTMHARDQVVERIFQGTLDSLCTMFGRNSLQFGHIPYSVGQLVRSLNISWEYKLRNLPTIIHFEVL
jgi:hypothetical protein